MKHIHIALVLFVCSFITLSCAKSTLVYRRYHRKRPSLHKTRKNVVEIVEVFKTVRKPPALMKSDKSIENFLLCDSKCEKKRFLKRRRMCLRTGRFCPTRPSGTKVSSTTQINVSTRPIYNKPTIYQANPYGNRNPDYTHLYPWSRPSVTVTKYPPDGSKDFNMTIVEVNNNTATRPIKDDYEYYDTDNDDRYQQRRSTTFRVPTTTSERIIPEITTIQVTEIPPETSTSMAPATLIDTVTSESPEPIRTTLTTTSEATLQVTELPIIITIQPEPSDIPETTTEFWMPAPSTPSIYFEPSTTPTTTEIPTSTTEEITTEVSTSTSTTTGVPTTPSTTTEVPTTPSTTTEVPTTPSTTTEVPTTPSTTTEVPTTPSTTTQTSTSTTASTTETPTTTEPPTILIPTTPTSQNQTEATNTELEEEGDEYGDEYEEGEGEEGTEELGEEENTQVDKENGNGNGNDGAYDYDDDGNYDDEEPA